MGQGRLARSRRGAAADQAGGADRVVRGAERTAARPAPPRRPQALAIRATSSASVAASGGRIEGSRLAASDLPAPGRADHQQAVAAGGGHLERVAQVRLPAQVGEVGTPGRARRAAATAARGRCGSHSPATRAGKRPRLSSAITSIPVASAASGPFSAGSTIASAPPSRAASAIASAPLHRSRRAVQRQLAGQRHPRQRLPLELAGGAQQRRGDRQVHTRPGLAQAGRGEVDDDPLQRELEAAVDQRRPHPLPRLAHRRVGEADDREAGQAAVDVDLDPDRAGGDAVEGEGSGRGEHGKDAKPPPRTC